MYIFFPTFFFRFFCLNVIVITVKWLLHIEILLQFNGMFFGSKCIFHNFVRYRFIISGCSTNDTRA